MKVKFKLGLSALALILVGISVFGLHQSSNAAVVAGNVYIIGQRPITATTSGGTSAFSCANAVGSRQVNTTNFPPTVGSFFLNTGTTTTAPTGLPLVEINNLSAAAGNLDTTNSIFTTQSFVYICVNTTPAGTPATQLTPINYNTGSTVGTLNDGDITFSAIVQQNMGYFGGVGSLFPTCTDPNGNGVVGETGSSTNNADNCVGTTGNGTAQLEIPFTLNNLNTVIVPFSCAQQPFATGAVMPVTINQNQGSFTFNILCKGAASAANTTISATPSTVEIIPARSNTSHSLILMKIQSAIGGPVFPGTDVSFEVLANSTAKCSIETAGLGVGTSAITDVFGNIVTNVPSLGTLVDGPSTLSIGAAIAMTSQLNTSAPGTYLTWEYSAAAQTPIDVLGGFAPFGTNAFTPSADITKAVDGFDLNGDGIPDFSLAAGILACNPLQSSATAGVANVQGCVQVLNAVDVCQTVTVKVVGPPAAITITASPTTVNCGEKSTITATVVDAIGQPVSDHTRVELVTNIGGVIGGTGAVAGFAAEVAPISSSVADTFGGVATGFLVTSIVHSGPYEVIATSGGTTSGDFSRGGFTPGDVFGFNITPNFVNSLGQSVGTVPVNILGTPIANIGPFQVFATDTALGGQFSTPPISAQVTVTCSLPVVAAPAPAPVAQAPAITAPRTGTGITPPNTGDAGLVGSSSGGANWSLFAIGGLIALSLAGFATVKAARR